MRDSLRSELSQVNPVRWFQSWMDHRIEAQHPMDRVIDAAIVMFLVSSVISITASQAFILVALAAWVSKLLRSRGSQPLQLPLLLPMAAFLLASILATLTAVDPYRSLRELRNVFQPALFYLVVNHINSDRQATTLTSLLIIVGTVAAAYGLSQSLVEGTAFRIRGTMSIWMTFAGILMLIATLALAHCLFGPGDKPSYWLALPLVLLIAALVMTHTRGAWLGLAAGATLILGFRKRLLLLMLPFIALSIFLIAPSEVQERIRSFVNLRDITMQERVYMWGAGLRMIRDYPWTGVGLDGVKGVYPAYQDPRASGSRWGHLHNNLIQVAVERGLFALACWLWIWVAFYRQAWQIYASLGSQAARAKALAVGSLAGITGFHVAGLFEYTFGDSEVITLAYFLMALPYIARGAAAQHASV